MNMNPDDTHLVEPEDACPLCGERRADMFEWFDDDRVRCASVWTKDLATDRDFYSVSIGYDRNSNITDVTDNIFKSSAGNHSFDVQYTMDGMNRVTKAEEGTFAVAGRQLAP